MKKVFKFLCLLILPLIILCSFVVPTYCINSVDSTLFKISLVDDVVTPVDSLSNYYNDNQLDRISLVNINIVPRGRYFGEGVAERVFYCANSIGYPTGWYTIETNRTFYYGGINPDTGTRYIMGDLYCLYGVYVTSSSIALTIEKSNFQCSDYGLKYSELKYGYCEYYIDLIPDEFWSMFSGYGNLTGCIFYGAFEVSYEIDYNGLYYYNDLFGVALQSTIAYWNGGVTGGDDSLCQEASCKIYVDFYDIYDNQYSSVLGDSFGYVDGVFLLDNNYNFQSSYINKVNLYVRSSAENYIVGLSGSGSGSVSHQGTPLGGICKVAFGPLFSYNSSSSSALGSSSIPSSGGFYKSCEWWDISTHLYNFFIFLVFDCPLISDFIQFVYVIIEFIVSVFETIIGLFTGVENSIFIAIFLGIIVLSFLLKIVFKG